MAFFSLPIPMRLPVLSLEMLLPDRIELLQHLQSS